MDLSGLASALQQLGCPPEKCPLLAEQLHKRAEQLAQRENKTYLQALEHLLSLMRQGWVAQGKS